MGIYILFYRPTILTGVTPEMQLCQEEIFGPVVSVQKFSDEKVSFLFYNLHLVKNILLKAPYHTFKSNLGGGGHC